jgi:hypothetical protein
VVHGGLAVLSFNKPDKTAVRLAPNRDLFTPAAATHRLDAAQRATFGDSTMRKILALATLAAVLFPLNAFAISRYQSREMSCEAVHQAIAREGAVILHYRSPRGNPLFDRYVASERQCDAYEYAEEVVVPTADMPQCPVYHCKRPTNLMDNN